MRFQMILKSIGAFALAMTVALIPLCSVLAIEPEPEPDTSTENEIEYIRLVSEPDTISEDVYYVMNGVKSDPASFTWVDGRFGKAVQLDGVTQHIRLATASVKKLSEFTFTAWVNWAGNDGEKEQRLLCAYKNDNHSLILSPHNTDSSQQLNGIQLTMEDPQLSNPISLHHAVDQTVTSALEANQWHHVAVALSDETVSLYIDGTLYASQTLEMFYVESMDLYRLVIGSEFEGDAQFKGLVDSAFLFPTALDADQIRLVAQNKKPVAGVKLPENAEVLATRPHTYDDTSAEEQPIRILGLSPLVFAILGGCVLLVVALSLLLSLYRKKTSKWPEEDYL